MIALLGCLIAAIALCGCNALLPTAEQQGDCRLLLRGPDGQLMEAPYRVSKTDHDARGGSFAVVYEADGWGFTTIETTDPDGVRTVSVVLADTLNHDFHGADFDRPGTWRFRLSDRDGCVQSFAVEVTP